MATRTKSTNVQTNTLDQELGAALLASGIGSTVLGVMTAGAEASSELQNALRWVGPVGPLSGVVGVAVIAFILSWIILHFVFARRSINLQTLFVVSLVLIGLGLLLTFPPVLLLFARE